MFCVPQTGKNFGESCQPKRHVPHFFLALLAIPGLNMSRESFIATLLTSLASLVLVFQAAAQSGDVAVVVSPDNPVTRVSSIELRKILAGEKRSWPSGRQIRIIVRAPGNHERLVLLKLLRISENQYQEYWAARVLRGEVDSEPVVVLSVGMQKEALRVFPDAITLVDAHDIKPGMKVLKVDGHLPGEPDYPVH